MPSVLIRSREWLLGGLESRLRSFILVQMAASTNLIRKDFAAMARTLAETLDVVRGLRTKVDSYQALFDGIKQQLADALAAAGRDLTPEQQAVVDQVFDEAKAAGDDLDASINENTPQAPTAPPEGGNGGTDGDAAIDDV